MLPPQNIEMQFSHGGEETPGLKQKIITSYKALAHEMNAELPDLDHKHRALEELHDSMLYCLAMVE